MARAGRATPPAAAADHDEAALAATLDGLDTTSGPPHVVVAETVFGKGVSFMEGQLKWHYWPMSDDEYHRALADVGAVAPGSGACEGPSGPAARDEASAEEA